MKRLKQLPFVSAFLVLANVIIYIICLLTGGEFYNQGILDLVDVLYRKEYGRVLSALFFHADIGHLFNNMLILFFLGAMLEREIGHIALAVLYFLSGTGGNLLSLWMKVQNMDMAGSLGASGAIFGLDGVLLALVFFGNRNMETVTLKRVLIMIALSLYSGFTGGNIDNAAHVGGFISGFLISFIIYSIRTVKEKRNVSR